MSMADWTAAMDTVLRRVIEAGGSYSDAAAEITGDLKVPVSRNAAIGRGHRIGLVAKRSFGGARGMASATKKTRTPRQRHQTPRPGPAPLPQESPCALRCVEVASLELAIYDLTDSTCRYPSADAPFTYCGNPVKAGSPYCGPHHSLCHGYVPPERRADAKRPGRKMSMYGTYYFNVEAA